MELKPAPEWQTTTWFNTPEPLSLERLRGRVLLLHAFQMLCPGCVAHGLPQAQRVAAFFRDATVAVVGIPGTPYSLMPACLASGRAFLAGASGRASPRPPRRRTRAPRAARSVHGGGVP